MLLIIIFDLPRIYYGHLITLSFYLIQIIDNINVDMSNFSMVETRLNVEGIVFHVTDQRIGAIALKIVYLPVERLIITRSPTNTIFGTTLKRIIDFDNRFKNTHKRRRLVTCIRIIGIITL